VAAGRLAALLDPRGRARAAQLAHALRRVPLFRDLPADDLVAVLRRPGQAERWLAAHGQGAARTA
jgi:hypothetical protein